MTAIITRRVCIISDRTQDPELVDVEARSLFAQGGDYTHFILTTPSVLESRWPVSGLDGGVYDEIIVVVPARLFKQERDKIGKAIMARGMTSRDGRLRWKLPKLLARAVCN